MYLQKPVNYKQKPSGIMEQLTLVNEIENKIYIDTSVKIGDYNMKFKASGYKTEFDCLFSVFIYDKLYELAGTVLYKNKFQWNFVGDNSLPEDLANVIGKEMERQTK